ncbi:GtrA family protein [Microbacterium dextranolyticum]|nr:GtrA family protein [Microbacterium dextranolyticum]MBM7463743.1 putative flippase GtrA [Microbacterium dextranolyticum]
MSERSGLEGLIKRTGAFLAVGGVAFVVDAVVFNLLVFGVGGGGPMHELPVPAKMIAIVVATVVTYVGNRYWTFGTRSIERKASRYVIFIVLNIIAMLLQLGCLAFSRYVLGLEGPVADNVAGTFVGQAVATVFRFFTYDRWVFPDKGTAGRAALESG